MLGNGEQIVIDNEPLLTSRKFGEFCSKHKIRHNRLTTCHPATNGKAKRSVYMLKLIVRANFYPISYCTFYVPRKATSIQSSRFIIFFDVIVPYYTTGCTLSALLFGHTIRTTLYLI